VKSPGLGSLISSFYPGRPFKPLTRDSQRLGRSV